MQGTALLSWAAGLVRSGALPLNPPAAQRSRAFPGMEAAKLALSQSRGMASIATRNRRILSIAQHSIRVAPGLTRVLCSAMRRILLLDLEEDGGDDDGNDPME